MATVPETRAETTRPARTRNAKEEAAKKLPGMVVVEDDQGKEHEFRVKRTGKALKRIIERMPNDNFERDDNGEIVWEGEGEARKKKEKEPDPLANVTMLYENIATVLIDSSQDEYVSAPDEDGIWHPRSEWLEDNLDFDVANDWMEMFVPTQQASAEGNADAETTRPSTDT